MTVLGEKLEQLREEYATAGKTSTFEALKVFLDPDNSVAPPSYDEVANRLCVTTGAVKTLIHRLRKRYTVLLREEVGRTVSEHEAELRSASNEFSGHCFALTLLGSYLTDAYNADIRCRGEVSRHLAHDVRQGAHARRVMESYQTWIGEGPELAVLRTLGLFDRAADEKALGALLRSPLIPRLTESLTDLRPTGWRTILARLRLIAEIGAAH
jgi:hypothetical protein